MCVHLSYKERVAQVVLSWLAANEIFSIFEDYFGFWTEDCGGGEEKSANIAFLLQEG